MTKKKRKGIADKILEELCEWTMLCGLATGHADDIPDLLAELAWQIDEMATNQRTPGAVQHCQKCGETWDRKWRGCLYAEHIQNRSWATKHCPIAIQVRKEGKMLP
jgi:hypothetical protein